MTNWLAAAGLTTIELVEQRFKPPPVNSSVIVLGRIVARPANVATPPETVTVLVPWTGPAPFMSAAVTTVLLSPVSRLPYLSSSSITGWVANAWPAVAVADGWVWITHLLAAAGLTTMLADVAAVRPCHC